METNAGRDQAGGRQVQLCPNKTCSRGKTHVPRQRPDGELAGCNGSRPAKTRSLATRSTEILRGSGICRMIIGSAFRAFSRTGFRVHEHGRSRLSGRENDEVGKTAPEQDAAVRSTGTTIARENELARLPMRTVAHHPMEPAIGVEGTEAAILLREWLGRVSD